MEHAHTFVVPTMYCMIYWVKTCVLLYMQEFVKNYNRDIVILLLFIMLSITCMYVFIVSCIGITLESNFISIKYLKWNHMEIIVFIKAL